MISYHDSPMTTNAGVADAAGVSTIRKTFEISETLKGNQGSTVSELTRETEFPKRTVFRHLATLRDLDYVVERGGGTRSASASWS